MGNLFKMITFSNSEYCDLLFVYGFCNGDSNLAKIEYEKRFPSKHIPDSSIFTKVFNYLRDNGRFPADICIQDQQAEPKTPVQMTCEIIDLCNDEDEVDANENEDDRCKGNSNEDEFKSEQMLVTAVDHNSCDDDDCIEVKLETSNRLPSQEKENVLSGVEKNSSWKLSENEDDELKCAKQKFISATDFCSPKKIVNCERCDERLSSMLNVPSNSACDIIEQNFSGSNNNSNHHKVIHEESSDSPEDSDEEEQRILSQIFSASDVEVFKEEVEDFKEEPPDEIDFFYDNDVIDLDEYDNNDYQDNKDDYKTFSNLESHQCDASDYEPALCNSSSSSSITSYNSNRSCSNDSREYRDTENNNSSEIDNQSRNLEVSVKDMIQNNQRSANVSVNKEIIEQSERDRQILKKKDTQPAITKPEQSVYKRSSEIDENASGDLDNVEENLEISLTNRIQNKAIGDQIVNNEEIAQHSASDVQTLRNKDEKQAILTPALPLRVRKRSSTAIDNTEEKHSNSKNKKKKKTELSIVEEKGREKSCSEKKREKETIKKKLKEIAEKDAEKREKKSKCQPKTSSVVMKDTKYSRNDSLVERFVKESKINSPRKPSVSESEVSQLNSKSTVDTENLGSSSGASKTLLDTGSSSSNTAVSDDSRESVIVPRRCKLSFSDGPVVQETGRRAHPCTHKDGLISIASRTNEVSNNVEVSNVNRNVTPLSNQNYSVDESIYCMLRWNVMQLHEHEVPNVSNNPRGVENVQDTRSEYDNFHDYFCVYQELLLHEVWSNVNDEFQWNSRRFQPISFIIDSLKTRNFVFSQSPNYKEFLTLECHRNISEDDLKKGLYQKVYEYGIITVQTFSRSKNKTRPIYVFCYIEKVQVVPTIPLQELSNFSNRNTGDMNFQSNMKRLNVTFLLKPLDKDMVIDQNVKIQWKMILSVHSFLRSFSSVITLRKSPLLKAVCNPSGYDFSTDELNFEMMKPPSFNKLDNTQQRAVTNCTKLCLNRKPNIAVVYGPPGTGKSKIIINTIENIIHNARVLNERPKILVCAPKTLAVDYLVEKLVILKEQLKKDPCRMELNIVHISAGSIDNQRISSVSLQKLVNERLNNNLDNYVAFEWYRRRNFATRDRRLAERDILKKADIICSTLSSSVFESMAAVYGSSRGLRLSCCIIDDAAQCTEPESIIPLQLNVSNLVLVGDHKQLPALVRSNVSIRHGFRDSLFYRIYSCWESSEKKLKGASPIHKLDIQYRMHTSIVKWPYMKFYNMYNIMVKSRYSDKYKYPLMHYVAINHSLIEDQEKKECNLSEMDLVLNLAMSILLKNSCGDLKLGIIVPHSQQQKILQEKLALKQINSGVVNRMRINTIEGCQGAEQDIVILSCVRPSGAGSLSDQRLNFALTRAKHSLFICANFELLRINQQWFSLWEDANERKLYINYDSELGIQSIMPSIIQKLR